MKGYTLKEYDGLGNTPVIELLPLAWAELNAEGWGTTDLLGSWDHQAIVASNTVDRPDGEHEEPVGFVTWDHQKWRKAAWLHVGWVHKSHRRRGIYRLMVGRFEALARKAGALELGCGVHVDNEASRAAHSALGFRDAFVTMRQPLPPFAPPEAPKILEATQGRANEEDNI